MATDDPRPWVLHVDMDQFIAAVEVLRRPELQGLPVVVGGRGIPTERGVVATASYEARAYGVRSGMPLRTALKRCPEAVFLAVDKPAYEEVSAQVMATLRAFHGATVEVIGWDEAFVGIEAADPEARAYGVKEAVAAATSLSCAVGIGETLVQAKMATGFAKPGGVYRLTRDTWLDVMGDRPTTDLWGIGPRIGARLRELGVTTVRELAATPPEPLVTALGPAGGAWVSQLGRGEGRASVDPTPHIARARGRETTYQQDLTDRTEVTAALRTLASAVVDDIRAEGRPCARVHLKVRFAPFFTFTKVKKLPEPTYDPVTIAEVALALFDAVEAAATRPGTAAREEGPGSREMRPVRLLGVRAEMVDP